MLGSVGLGWAVSLSHVRVCTCVCGTLFSRVRIPRQGWHFVGVLVFCFSRLGR